MPLVHQTAVNLLLCISNFEPVLNEPGNQIRVDAGPELCRVGALPGGAKKVARKISTPITCTAVHTMSFCRPSGFTSCRAIGNCPRTFRGPKRGFA